MGKKEKSAVALTEDLKTLITLIPKLAAFIRVHNEIAVGYQKYRKNGGEAISGIEKHLGIKIPKSADKAKVRVKAAAPASEAKAPKEDATVKKVVKKVKK